MTSPGHLPTSLPAGVVLQDKPPSDGWEVVDQNGASSKQGQGLQGGYMSSSQGAGARSSDQTISDKARELMPSSQLQQEPAFKEQSRSTYGEPTASVSKDQSWSQGTYSRPEAPGPVLVTEPTTTEAEAVGGEAPLGVGAAGAQPHLVNTGIPPVFHPPKHLEEDITVTPHTRTTGGTAQDSDREVASGRDPKAALEPLTKIPADVPAEDSTAQMAKKALEPLTRIPAGTESTTAESTGHGELRSEATASTGAEAGWQHEQGAQHTDQAAGGGVTEKVVGAASVVVNKAKELVDKVLYEEVPIDQLQVSDKQGQQAQPSMVDKAKQMLGLAQSGNESGGNQDLVPGSIGRISDRPILTGDAGDSVPLHTSHKEDQQSQPSIVEKAKQMLGLSTTEQSGSESGGVVPGRIGQMSDKPILAGEPMVTSTACSATQQCTKPGTSGTPTPVVDTPIAHAVEAHGIEGALDDVTGPATAHQTVVTTQTTPVAQAAVAHAHPMQVDLNDPKGETESNKGHHRPHLREKLHQHKDKKKQQMEERLEQKERPKEQGVTTPVGPKPAGGDPAYPGTPNSAHVGMPPTGNPDPLGPVSPAKPAQELDHKKVDEEKAAEGAKKEVASTVKYEDPANPITGADAHPAPPSGKDEGDRRGLFGKIKDKVKHKK